MNKIYQEPIKKAELLIDGVKSCADSLLKKGISIDVEALGSACRALEEAAVAQDEADAKLKEAREAAHKCLDELKEISMRLKLLSSRTMLPRLGSHSEFRTRNNICLF